MPATADYLAEHPFASPDVVDPPEAPLYRYRPDINDLVELAALETETLGPGSRVDIIRDDHLESWVLKSGTTTGGDDQLQPDDYDAITNEVYWQLFISGSGSFAGLTFDDISGQIALSQLPTGSLVTLDDPNHDAVYFWDDAANQPALIGPDLLGNFISGNIGFGDVTGQLALAQLPDGTVATLDDPGVDAFYFWDEAAQVPILVDMATAATSIGLDAVNTRIDALTFGDIAGLLSLSQLPDGTVATLDDPGFDAVYFWDDIANGPGFLQFDTDVTLAADADDRVASQHAVKAYVDAAVSGAGGTGDVVGPASSIDSEIVLFNSTTGKLIKRATGSGLAKVTSGVYSTITDSSSNWDTAYTERHQWDGGSTNLTAATGRTSLGLGTLATQSGTFSGTSSGTNTGDQTITLTGNVTGSGTGSFAATIANSAVTLAKMADIATSSLIYRKTAGTGAPEVNTLATLKTDLGLTGTNSGDQDLSSYATTAAVAAGYQPLDTDLTTIAGLTATTDNFIVSVSSAWASRTPAQVRTTLGLVIGTNVQAWDTDLDTWATLTPSANFQTLVPHTFAQMRTDLSLVVGTNVQAWDADLDALAALSGTNTIYYRSAANTWSAVTIGANLTFSGGSLAASGGGGSVATDTIFDAKGDLAVGTGADTAAKLTAGANDTMLMADSTQTTGLKWATPTVVRTALGLVIGTNVQAWDADLDTWAGVTPASGVATFLATPSSANLRAAMTDELGTGACIFDGATLVQTLTFATNSTSLAPMNVPGGTLRTTPADGDIEADANCFYGCTDAGNRGYLPVIYTIRADGAVTQANDANAHAIFTTPTNGRLTLATGVYRFHGLLAYTAMSATSGNVKIDILGAGGATIVAWLWTTWGADVTSAAAPAAGGQGWWVTSASAASAIPAGTSTACVVNIDGTFKVTAGGTIIPTQTMGAASASVLTSGSYIEFWRVGSTSMTSVGAWD